MGYRLVLGVIAVAMRRLASFEMLPFFDAVYVKLRRPGDESLVLSEG